MTRRLKQIALRTLRKRRGYRPGDVITINGNGTEHICHVFQTFQTSPDQKMWSDLKELTATGYLQWHEH
jgi:hypothetical protein